METTNQFNLYNKIEYLEQLIHGINLLKKGEKVSLVTMGFDPDDPYISKLLNSANAAAKRGVDVVFVVDAMTFLIRGELLPGPLFFSAKMPGFMFRSFRRRLVALERLKSNGARYIITNKPKRPFSVPFKGRSHIKFAVVGNDVFVGGCNLRDSLHSDLMIGWHDLKTAHKLHSFSRKLITTSNVLVLKKYQDKVIPLNNAESLIFDSGVERQSLILEEAFKLIDDAKEKIVFTCQYFPNSTTINRLQQAYERGVNVKIIYNNPRKRSFPNNLLHYVVKKYEQTRRPKEFFIHERGEGKPFIHSKVLVTDSGCLIGSHNLIQAGVNFGTAEVALVSYDARLGKQILEKLESIDN